MEAPGGLYGERMRLVLLLLLLAVLLLPSLWLDVVA